ncbi:hypothetical protein AOQ84DRAFT_438177, partial [Glonium stellatum]
MWHNQTSVRVRYFGKIGGSCTATATVTDTAPPPATYPGNCIVTTVTPAGLSLANFNKTSSPQNLVLSRATAATRLEIPRAAFSPSAQERVGCIEARLDTGFKSSSECEASCTIEYPQVKVLQWMPIQNIEYSTTLTAATLIYVINNRTNTTSTLTEYNQLPDGYTTSTPVLNSDGKVVSTITVPQPNGAALTTAIVYPTEFLDYAPSYEWQGILPTRTLSHSTCATINATTSPYSTPLATLPSHPLYPQPTTASFPSENTTDTVGTAHTLAWAVTFDNAAPSFYKTAFPDEAAFTACDFTISSFPTQAPGITHTTAKFLTERTTRYTNGIDSGPTPPVSQPAPHTEESIRP